MKKNTPPNPAIGRVQPSIRSFFQPRQPIYTPPPSTSTASPNSISNTSQPPPKPEKEQNVDSASSLPQSASISPISESHIAPLRRINSLLLPISYYDSFYYKILQPSPPSATNFSRVILWSQPEPKVIGGLVCRLDPAHADDFTLQAPKFIEGVYDIYIQSLVLLSPYRGKGLATSVLEAVVCAAIAETEVRIQGLYAHVWTENTEALKWYLARGFKTEPALMPGYYRCLKPDTAWMLRRRLRPSDHLYHSHAQPAQSDSLATPAPTPSSAAAAPSRPPPAEYTRSFQARGPEREWNDLPEDVVADTLLKPTSMVGTPAEGSVASSRSSSRSGMETKGKRKRVYPAAAFSS